MTDFHANLFTEKKKLNPKMQKKAAAAFNLGVKHAKANERHSARFDVQQRYRSFYDAGRKFQETRVI